MASTYSNLKIQLMATGENATTWGTVTNTNLGTAIEEAISGSADVTFASNNQTLTLSDTNATQTARNMRLNLTGTTGGSTRTLTVPNIEKMYLINNGCGDAIEVKNSTGANVSVPAGGSLVVFSTGTGVVPATSYLPSLTLGTPLPVASGGTGSNTGTFSGANITSLNASNISSGVLAVGNGGTGSATATFSGANITSLNASAISSGTLDNARTTASSSNGASTIVARDAGGNFSANIISATFNGDGSSVTGINATNISSGTLDNTRTTASSSNGASTIVARDASGNFTGYNISATNFIGTLNGSGANVTSLNASNITSGTISNNITTASSANGASTIVARDASGNFTGYNISATNFIGTLNGSGANVTSLNASNISSGTISNSITTASSSNGASTIVARDASGNFSANIITANGSSLTSLNATSLSTGTVSSLRLPAGTVLQVLFATITTQTNFTSSTNYTDATNFNLAITPKSSSSKILITINAAVTVDNYNNGSAYAGLQIARNTTGVFETAVGNYGGLINTLVPVTYLDSPATTSSVTYKLQVKRVGSNAGNFYVNQSNTILVAKSTITLMEIAG